MTDFPRLVLFDVDGTLVDSQAAIVAAMTAAFDALDLPVPARGDILSIVGLSLDHAIARLAPDLSRDQQGALVQGYKTAYMTDRQAADGKAFAPLYPGVLAVLDHLSGLPDLVLGVATGKSRRGLTALLEAHDLRDRFVTCQTADDHPSKPHPSMILRAMDEAATDAATTVMIGDTSFDMDMARAAGVPGIGVSWGYHPVDRLGADHLIDHFDALPGILETIWTANS